MCWRCSRRLTKLDVIELRAEADKPDAEHAHLTELLSSPDALEEADRRRAGGDGEAVRR